MGMTLIQEQQTARLSKLQLAVEALRCVADELKERGIVHAGIFGSVSRGEDRPESDIDIVVDLDTDRVGDILDFIDLIGRIEEVVRTELPGAAVDVANKSTLKPKIRDAVAREAIYAF